MFFCKLNGIKYAQLWIKLQRAAYVRAVTGKVFKLLSKGVVDQHNELAIVHF